MSRVKFSIASRKRRKKILKQVRGYRGGRSKLIKTAMEALHRSWAYAYRDRKARKQQFRRLWIIRINAAVRENGLTYSRFMNGLASAGIKMDRKTLAYLAVNDPAVFTELVEKSRAAQ